MLKMVLVLAGATELDQQNRIKGSLDVPLCREGAQQVEKMASEIDEMELDAIYAGPCLAVQQTAEQISRSGDIKVKTEENLRNLNRGLWSGKSIDELKANQPKVYRQWQENPETICPPDGESIEEARTRAEQTVKKIRRKHKKGHVALVVSEPFASVLRSVIDEKVALENLWDAECRSGCWEWVPDTPKIAV